MNNRFSQDDGIDLKDLFNAQISNIQTLIAANDKNYNQRFDNVIESTKTALATADRAVNKAETATEKRFDAVNEFRSVLTSQQNTFAPRSEIDLININITQRLEKVEKGLVGLENKGLGVSQGVGWVVALVSFVITIVALFLKIK